jgi:type II secretion system protein I
MRSGFSLLEALVALTILGLAAVASLASLGAQLRGADRARAALVGEALAQDRLARLRLARADALAHLPDSLARGRFPRPWAGFRWTATSRTDRERPDLVEVTVEIVSPDSRSSLATVLYRP